MSLSERLKSCLAGEVPDNPPRGGSRTLKRSQCQPAHNLCPGRLGLCFVVVVRLLSHADSGWGSRVAVVG